MKRTVLSFGIYWLVLLNSCLCFAGCSKDKSNKEITEEQNYIGLETGRKIEETIKERVLLKEKEYKNSPIKANKIDEAVKKIQDEHDAKKEKMEDEFNSKYQQILDYIDNLKQMKFKLEESKQRIEDLIDQSRRLNDLIKGTVNVRDISEQLFKHSLNSISHYFLLLGKSPQGVSSMNEVKGNIVSEMERFLNEEQCLIFEFKSNSTLRDQQLEIQGQLIRKETVYPDDREDSVKKNGIIYMYKVYRHYPFYIHEQANENEELNDVYDKLIMSERSSDIVRFKIKGGEGGGAIKYIDFNSGQSALDEIMSFFDYPLQGQNDLKKKYTDLINELRKSDIKSLKKINEKIHIYDEKFHIFKSDIEMNKNFQKGIIKNLKDLQDFENSVNQLIILAGKIYSFKPRSLIKGVEEERDNIKKNIYEIIEGLEKGRDVSKLLKSLNEEFNRLFDEIDKLNQDVKKIAQYLITKRDFDYMEKGVKLEDPEKDQISNFIDAALEAYRKLKEKKMGSWADAIVLEKDNNIKRLKARDFYNKGRIVSIEIPLLFKKTIKTDPENEGESNKYFVFLKAKVVFEMKDILGIEDYGAYVKDNIDNILWSKYREDYYVVFENAPEQDSALSLLDKLNTGLSEEELQKGKWTLPKKEDLIVLMQREGLFKALNIQLDRSYWTPDRVGVFYLTYKFQKNANDEMELILEQRVSSDGAYCIFIKKITEGRNNEDVQQSIDGEADGKN